ncbi:MAG: hypothetical protein WC348_00875 [Patescibacteria group bacterium]|jgi:hypothetical protein
MDNEEEGTFDVEGRRAFVSQQLQDYRMCNPEIRQIIYKIWGLNSIPQRHDFLAAMWPLFLGLKSVTKLLGELPIIQKASADQTWTELYEAPDNALDGEDFDEFRIPIEVEFKMNLAVSVKSPDVKRRVERNFAMILRMIQIERGAKPNSSV